MLVWAAGARRAALEEALRPLDGHRTITAARIVYIDEVDKALGTRQLSRPTTQIWQRTYSPFAICKNVQPIF